MLDERLNQDLFNHMNNNSKIAIFGACPVGEKILNDIKKNRSNVEIIGFIDNFEKGKFCNLPIFSLKEFIERKIECDLVVMSTRNRVYSSVSILRIYNYNVLVQSSFVYNYYRNNFDNKNTYLNDENFEKVIKIFRKQEDKDLFELIFNVRRGLEDRSMLAEYYNAKFPEKMDYSIISSQYLDKINKNCPKIVFDLGFNSGLNAVAYNRYLPKLEKIYGFEAIYDKCADSVIESIINNEKLEIIKSCVGEKRGFVKFIINLSFPAQSRCLDITSMNVVHFENQEEIISEVITLDEFCKENNVYPDLIKTDIEGAEMPALKGAINMIQSCRPQLAISIYHSNKDFIEIPLFLSEKLDNYTFEIEHYRTTTSETILYAIPNELYN